MADSGRSGGYVGKLTTRLAEQWSEWDPALEAWLESRYGDDDDSVDEPEPSLTDVLADPLKSWNMYVLCSLSEWKQLPREGGWENQTDTFLHDMQAISRRLSYLRSKQKRNKEIRKKAQERLGILDRFRRG